MTQTKAELREELSVLRGLFDQIPAMIWSTDSNLMLKSLRGGATKSLGLVPGQLQGVHIYEFFGTDDPQFPPIRAHVHALRGESVQYDFEFQGVWSQCHVQPLYDAEGHIDGVTGVAVEVTALKQADRSREELIRRLERSLEELEALRGRVKICAHCRRVRDEAGHWRALDDYLCSRHATIFNHGICADCIPSDDVDRR